MTLEDLIAMRNPNVHGGPNWTPAIGAAAYNRALADVAEALDLATKDEAALLIKKSIAGQDERSLDALAASESKALS